MRGIQPVKILHCSPEDIPVPFQSICRYMGLGNSQPDSELEKLIKQSLVDFKNVVYFSACYMVVPVSVTDGESNFSLIKAPGKSLAKHLADCEKAILFAATTGIEAERQRKRASVLSPAKALALDAVGTASIEAFCDRLCAKWAAEYSDSALRPRFSPGYGDLQLEFQKPLLSLLDASRNAGITLTDTMLMIPQKSVSAIVGIGKTGCTAKTPDCMACEKQDCAFRL